MGLTDLRTSKKCSELIYIFNSKEAILPPEGTIYTDINMYSDSLTEIRCASGRQLYQQDFVYRRVRTSVIYIHLKSQMHQQHGHTVGCKPGMKHWEEFADQCFGLFYISVL